MCVALNVVHKLKIKKAIKMKKSILILIMVTTGFLCFGQQDSAYVGTSDSVKAKVVIKSEPKGPTKAGLAKATEDGTIYNSTSPYHNVSHEFTYLVAMRDYCDKTLLQMRDNGESDSYRMNKKLSKELKRELSKVKSKLDSSKYNGLKIESDYYEMFLKQINDRFKD